MHIRMDLICLRKGRIDGWVDGQKEEEEEESPLRVQSEQKSLLARYTRSQVHRNTLMHTVTCIHTNITYLHTYIVTLVRAHVPCASVSEDADSHTECGLFLRSESRTGMVTYLLMWRPCIQTMIL